MGQYTINSSPKTHATHRILVGAPLILVMLFSFGFVLVHPASSEQVRPTATNQVAQSTASSAADKESTGLPPIPLAEQTTAPTLSPAPQAADTPPAGGGAATATPQTAGISSRAASTNPQVASPNNQSINAHQPISTKANLPSSLLTNLLH